MMLNIMLTYISIIYIHEASTCGSMQHSVLVASFSMIFFQEHTLMLPIS